MRALIIMSSAAGFSAVTRSASWNNTLLVFHSSAALKSFVKHKMQHDKLACWEMFHHQKCSLRCFQTICAVEETLHLDSTVRGLKSAALLPHSAAHLMLYWVHMAAGLSQSETVLRFMVMKGHLELKWSSKQWSSLNWSKYEVTARVLLFSANLNEGFCNVKRKINSFYLLKVREMWDQKLLHTDMTFRQFPHL